MTDILLLCNSRKVSRLVKVGCGLVLVCTWFGTLFVVLLPLEASALVL